MSMPTIMTHGLAMPKLGLGTWKLAGEACVESVGRALTLGYRHIDTAEMYGNEAEIGAAIRASGIPRSEIFLTTKVWHDNLAPDALRHAFNVSLRKLDTGYVDLYMIHWPSYAMNLEAALTTMGHLRQEGRVRHLGVSNFPVALLHQAVEMIGAPIACNQVEYHALLSQKPLLDYARAHDVAITAYCPLAQGRLSEHPTLVAIAAKHKASPAQVALAWLLEQENVAAIPKAGRESSQRANLDALSIKLDDSDRAAIAALPKNQRFVDPGFAPLWDASGISVSRTRSSR